MNNKIYNKELEKILKIARQITRDYIATYQTDRKLNFLLHGEGFPDNIGKYNNQVNKQLTHTH